jgi:hypothetical protein
MIQIMVPHLKLSPLIPLPPIAKLSKVTISLAILTVIPHHSPWGLLVHLLGWFGHSWWRLMLRKGFLRDVWKSVKWVPEVVWFGKPHLFWRWSFWGLSNHTIFHNGLGRLRWGDLG